MARAINRVSRDPGTGAPGWRGNRVAGGPRDGGLTRGDNHRQWRPRDSEQVKSLPSC